jgi:hypothetical protein
MERFSEALECYEQALHTQETVAERQQVGDGR